MNKDMGSLNLFKKLVQVSLFCSILIFPSAFYCAGDKPITSIAFGSCLKETRPQPIWESVIDLKPDIFVLLGGTIIFASVVFISYREAVVSKLNQNK